MQYILRFSVFSVLFAFSILSHASIGPANFKGVEERIHKSFQHRNPMWGRIALDSGIIHNLRFYGTLEQDFSSGMRNFTKDENTKDPTWQLIKRFFPSPTGTIETTTNHPQNFGRYIGTEEAPVIAALFELADKARDNHMTTVDKASVQKIVHLFSSSQKELGTTNFKSLDKFSQRVVKPVLDLIVKAVGNEGKFYPKYFTDVLISAFFVEKFNNQIDIWNLLRSFEVGVAHSVPTQEEIITNDDVRLISLQKTFTLEALYNLILSDILFSAVTPYADGSKLISNDSIRAYDRQHDSLLSTYFSDCVDTAYRHIFNLVAFDSVTKRFNLEPLKSRPATAESPFIALLDSFYSLQTPHHANDSSQAIRNAWNKVAADVNRLGQGPEVTYVKPDVQNELETGFINLVRWFSRVLAFDLPKAPAERGQLASWISESLVTMFEIINPRLKFSVSENLNFHKNEVYGSMVVTALKNRVPTYSFIISQSEGHASIKDVKTLVPRGLELKTLAAEQLSAQTLLSYQECLRALMGITSSEMLFSVFPKALDNNHERKDWLESFSELEQFPNRLIVLNNVLRAVSWEDPETVKTMMPAIQKLLSDPSLRKIALESVEGIYLESPPESQSFRLGEFLNLRHVEMASGVRFDPADLSEVKHKLESIYATVSDENAQIVIDNFTKLTSLKLKYATKFKKLVLSNLPRLDLRSMDIYDMRVEELEINQIQTLTDFNIENYFIDRLSLKNLPTLKTIYDGQEQRNNWEQFAFFDSHRHSYSLRLENVPELTTIDLSGSLADHVTLVDSAPRLKSLNLPCAITVADFTGTNFPSLERISLGEMKGDLTIDTMNLLESISIEFSDMSHFSVKHAPNLKFIYLESSTFEEVNLDDLPSLTSIVATSFKHRPLKCENTKISFGTIKNVNVDAKIRVGKDYCSLSEFKSCVIR